MHITAIKQILTSLFLKNLLIICPEVVSWPTVLTTQGGHPEGRQCLVMGRSGGHRCRRVAVTTRAEGMRGGCRRRVAGDGIANVVDLGPQIPCHVFIEDRPLIGHA
jgi:hypothetical protein